MAGKTLAFLQGALGADCAIVRAMPNTPAAVGRGITVGAPNAKVSPAQHDIAHRLLAAIGAVEWVEDEALIDAVTAVSGSGPAYVFLLAESLARAGATAGLPADLAARLARATVSGSGELLHRSPLDAATLAPERDIAGRNHGGGARRADGGRWSRSADGKGRGGRDEALQGAGRLTRDQQKPCPRRDRAGYRFCVRARAEMRLGTVSIGGLLLRQRQRQEPAMARKPQRSTRSSAGSAHAAKPRRPSRRPAAPTAKGSSRR